MRPILGDRQRGKGATDQVVAVGRAYRVGSKRPHE